MKKLRVTARVYDTTTFEYVQRHAEIPIPDEVVEILNNAKRDENGSTIHAFGHGDKDHKEFLKSLKTPLRNTKRYHIDPQLALIDVDENGNKTIVGGWMGM